LDELPAFFAARVNSSMLGAFEFERAITVERVSVGIAHAKASGPKSGKAIGRPALKAKRVDTACAALAEGQGIRATALAAGISVGSAAALRRRWWADSTRPPGGR
jgi:DNA invertase Pin-like site-specific DNA recombinase